MVPPSLPFTREVTTAIFRLSCLPWKSKDGAREEGIPALQRGKRDEARGIGSGKHAVAKSIVSLLKNTFRYNLVELPQTNMLELQRRE